VARRGSPFYFIDLEKTMTFFLAVVVCSVAVTGIIDAVQRRMFGVRPGVMIEDQPVERLYHREVRALLEGMAAMENVPPQNAYIHKTTGKVMPEVPGVELNIDETLFRVMAASPGQIIYPTRYIVYPRIRTADLEQITATLAGYATGLIGSWQRTENIKLAAAAINNTLLMPGEEFSFNGVVGERTAERGYRAAPIFVGEGVVPGLGGGICQVSSTLYNVVLRTPGLIVTERVPHSRRVAYVPPGKDATVAWPHTDFKFRNERKTPIVIRAQVYRGRIAIEIDGVPDG
jgi:vancomycin resistance protein YoaR